jgi:hypothetical protein
MTKEEAEKLREIVLASTWDTRKNILTYLETVSISEEKPKGKRTGTQNNALHKGFELIANALNDAGLDMRKVLKPDVLVPWNTLSVKEYLFRPVMKLVTQKESTTELDKTKEIDDVWETVMRFLMENHHVEYIPFPHDVEKQKENMGGYKSDDRKHLAYPEYTGEPTF